jgi:hypothetical protein
MLRHDPRARTGPMTAVPFDTLKLARQLREKAGFTPEHAEAAAEALAEAVGGADLVTKADLAIALRDLEQRLTIRLGGMLIVAVGVILAALRYLPASHP